MLPNNVCWSINPINFSIYHKPFEFDHNISTELVIGVVNFPRLLRQPLSHVVTVKGGFPDQIHWKVQEGFVEN